eukprot:711914-Prorocentrum_minimum.AAC.4
MGALDPGRTVKTLVRIVVLLEVAHGSRECQAHNPNNSFNRSPPTKLQASSLYMLPEIIRLATALRYLVDVPAAEPQPTTGGKGSGPEGPQP